MAVPEEYFLYALRQVPPETLVVREGTFRVLGAILSVLMVVISVLGQSLQLTHQNEVGVILFATLKGRRADFRESDHLAAFLTIAINLLKRKLNGLTRIDACFCF